jgi:hypothetical protein
VVGVYEVHLKQMPETKTQTCGRTTWGWYEGDSFTVNQLQLLTVAG